MTATKNKRILTYAIPIGIGVLLLIAAGIFLFTGLKISPIGETQTEIAVNAAYTEKGAEASYLFFDLSDRVVTEGSPDPDITGSYPVTYTVSFLWKTATAQRTVTVADRTPPEIVLTGETELTLSDIGMFREGGYTATDNYDGDLTGSVTVTKQPPDENGTVLFLYEVSDSSGNRATATRTVRVIDLIPPTVVQNGDPQITIHTPQYTDTGAVAFDDLDGDISARITVVTDYKQNTLGTFSFVYSVSDSAGNEASCTRTVTVTDTTPPVIKLKGDAEISVALNDTYREAGFSATDDFDGDLTGSVRVSGTVNAQASGIYTLTYTVTDASGNSAKAVRTVYVGNPPVLLDVPFIDQRKKYPNGCESVSTVMALQYLGVNMSVDTFIDTYLDTCELPKVINGEKYGNSPWDYYLGDPRADSGLCCYAPVISHACGKFAAQYGLKVNELYNVSVDDLCHTYIDNGLPVIFFATLNMSRPYQGSLKWILNGTDGQVFQWTGPMHCLLLTGYDDSFYYFNDPMVGKNVKYLKSDVRIAYKGLFSQAVVIEKAS